MKDHVRMTWLKNYYIKIYQHKGIVMNRMLANIILYMKWCMILNCNTQARNRNNTSTALQCLHSRFRKQLSFVKYTSLVIYYLHTPTITYLVIYHTLILFSGYIISNPNSTTITYLWSNQDGQEQLALGCLDIKKYV